MRWKVRHFFQTSHAKCDVTSLPPQRHTSLITESQKNVSGEVRLKLYKGNVIAAGVRSEKSLYDEDIATMEGGSEESYDQDDATGFIRLNGLRLRTFAKSGKLKSDEN